MKEVRAPSSAPKRLSIAALIAVFLAVGFVPSGAIRAADTATAAPAALAVEVAQAASSSVAEDANDPLEPVNRFIFGFNEIFLDYLLGPISQGYEFIVPALMREGIHNFLNNLSTPVILANDILQGEPQRAMETLGRALVNTTVGMGGLIDMGSELGVKRHSEDFGQTLGVWGVGEMFYVVLPFYGPSNPRDAVGKLLVDGYFDPLGMWISNANHDDLKWARTGTKAVDEYSGVRSDLEQVKKTSIDYYAAIRSLYRQKRQTEISNGKDIKLPPIPDLTHDRLNMDDPEAATAQPPAKAPARAEGSDQLSYRLVNPDQIRD